MVNKRARKERKELESCDMIETRKLHTNSQLLVVVITAFIDNILLPLGADMVAFAHPLMIVERLPILVFPSLQRDMFYPMRVLIFTC